MTRPADGGGPARQPVPPRDGHAAGPRDRVFHPWFVSQFALGVCLLAGGFFMVPAYLDSSGVSSADIGIVVSLIGVGALLSPVLGRVADRFWLHRWMQLLGVAAAVVACLGFSVAESMWSYALSALALGLGQAAIMSMNASLVMGSGVTPAVEAASITALAAMLQLGQTLGLLVVSIGTGSGVSYPTLFVAFAVVALLSFVVTAATNGESARRLRSTATRAARGTTTPGRSRVGLGAVAVSALGAFLLAVTLSQTGQLAIETQLPIYMDGVFGIDAAQVSAALSVAAGICLLTFVPIGRWTARAGPMPAWLLAQGLRVVGMSALLAVGTVASSASVATVVPLGVYMVAYLAYPLFNAAAPVVVGRVAAATGVGSGEAQGLYVGALAVCGIVGPIIGGAVAGSVGLAALPWVALIGAGAALAVTLLWVRPRAR